MIPVKSLEEASNPENTIQMEPRIMEDRTSTEKTVPELLARFWKAKNLSIRPLIPVESQEEVSTPENTIQMKPRAEVYSEQRKLYVKRNTLK